MDISNRRKPAHFTPPLTLKKEFDGKARNPSVSGLLPSQARLTEEVVKRIYADLDDARKVIDYTRKRVFEGETLPAREKILSLADGSAAYISKGGREPVIGYKPQLVHSANGFIAELNVPLGNAADSAQLVPCIPSGKGFNRLFRRFFPIVHAQI